MNVFVVTKTRLRQTRTLTLHYEIVDTEVVAISASMERAKDNVELPPGETWQQGEFATLWDCVHLNKLEDESEQYQIDSYVVQE